MMISSVDTRQWRMEIIIVNFTLGLVSDLGEQRSDQHKTGQNSIYFFFNTDVTTTHSEERLEYSGFLFQIVVQT